MMFRWLLACSLALCCSLAAGCGDAEKGAGPNASTEETQASKNAKEDFNSVKTSLTSARESISKAQQLSPATATVSPPTNQKPSKSTNKGSGGADKKKGVDPKPLPPEDDPDDSTTARRLKDAITAAISDLTSLASPLADLKHELSEQPETQEGIKSLDTVETSVEEALKKLQAIDQEDLKSNSTERSTLLKDANSLVDAKALTALNNVKIPNDLQPSNTFLNSVMDIGIWVAIVLGAILGLLLIVAAGRALIKSSAARADARIKMKIQPLASAIQKQQADVASQIADLTTSQNDLRKRVAELEFEIKKVARLARDAGNDGVGRRSPAQPPAFSSFEEPVERDEPVFPISIGDYLSKMQRSSNIVRPDFQNDILVSDPGGTGELVLIRDTAISDDLQPLFVVPRAAQFQTKQDFYTYYQKYYECARPSAGDVWIIDPAVVSKVSGGWQLREKGVLEVR